MLAEQLYDLTRKSPLVIGIAAAGLSLLLRKIDTEICRKVVIGIAPEDTYAEKAVSTGDRLLSLYEIMIVQNMAKHRLASIQRSLNLSRRTVGIFHAADEIFL